VKHASSICLGTLDCYVTSLGYAPQTWEETYAATDFLCMCGVYTVHVEVVECCVMAQHCVDCHIAGLKYLPSAGRHPIHHM